jgi:hypothetical protein
MDACLQISRYELYSQKAIEEKLERLTAISGTINTMGLQQFFHNQAPATFSEPHKWNIFLVFRTKSEI